MLTSPTRNRSGYDVLQADPILDNIAGLASLTQSRDLPVPVSMQDYARQVIEAEADAVRNLAAGIHEGFDRAVNLILGCRGALVTSGIGKAGHIARKLSASFASTGTLSHFLNPGDAMHGDLGSVRRGDVVLLLSYSGTSDEILQMGAAIKKMGVRIVSITSSRTNLLGLASDIVLEVGKIDEPCSLGLAPSASTTAMLAMGDALFLSVMKARNFTTEDFAQSHPAGNLGRKLMRVREAMGFRAGENLPVASDKLTVGEVLHSASRAGSTTKRSNQRRSGAVLLTDENGKISGIFTDGDLRRLITSNDAAPLRRPIREVMTHDPKRILGDRLASEAIAIMRPLRIDDLPVVDSDDRPIGLIDIQDLVVLRMVDVEPTTP